MFLSRQSRPPEWVGLYQVRMAMTHLLSHGAEVAAAPLIRHRFRSVSDQFWVQGGASLFSPSKEPLGVFS